MEQIILDSGRMVGLANGRKIGMGRFKTVSFEVADATLPAAA